MAGQLTKSNLALASLRKRWGVVAILCIGLLAVGFQFLSVWWQRDYATRWATLAALVCLYLLWNLWHGLEVNQRPGESQLLPTLGIGNQLTLLRALLIACLAGFLFSPRPEGWLAWLPGLLYTLASIIDIFDGYMARRTRHATLLGERLDLSFDGLGVLIGTALIVQYGQVPAWYLLVALARYLFLGGVWLRVRLAKAVYALPPSSSRRPLAGAQMGFIAVMLWPLFSPPGTHLAATLFAIPFLAGFVRDWLAVSGVIQSRTGGMAFAHPGESNLPQALTSWLPLLVRAAILILISVSVAGTLLNYPQTVDYYAAQGIPFPEAIVLSLSLLQLLVGLMIALGAGGRAAAVIGLGLLGLYQIITPLSPLQMLLIALYTGLMYLGTGTYSLWKPEERLLFHRLGEQAS